MDESILQMSDAVESGRRSTFYLDAHNHLQHPALADHLDELLNVCRELPVSRMVVNGTAESDWSAVATLAARTKRVIPSFGLHPWYLANRTCRWREALRSTLLRTRAAVGEAGLDLWMLDPDLLLQTEVLRRHLELASELNRPITIHCLKAWSPLRDVLCSSPLPKCGFLLHAYSGPVGLIDPFAALGAYFSFSGYFLHPRKRDRQAIFSTIPGDRLLAETDAPDMALPGDRAEYTVSPGQSGLNHPANIRAVYRGLAAIRGMEEGQLGCLLAGNFRRLFASVLPDELQMRAGS